MIYLLIFLIQVALVTADIVYYRRCIRRSEMPRARKRALLTWMWISDSLPFVIIFVTPFTHDNTTTYMLFSMWTFFAWLTTALPRGVFYAFRIFGLHRTGVVLGCALAGVFLWGALYGRTHLIVNEVAVHSADVPPAFEGFRIVQFSDVHVGTMLRPEHELRRLVERINALKPDLIVFSGDLVNVRYTELTRPLMDILKGLKAPYGVMSVLGNHDVGIYVKKPELMPPWENLAGLVAREREMGWQVLEDQTVPLYRGGDSILISGIAFDKDLIDMRHNTDIPNVGLDNVYQDVLPEQFNITISHLPQLWQEISNRGHGDLILSGHVHSMQIKLDMLGLRLSPAQLLYTQWSGLYERDGSTLYVNDGIGYVLFPMRIGAFPEITLLTLSR